MNKPTNIDVLIAGQGAAAFSAGLYSVRYQMKTVVVGELFGGETAIGGLIENYPGQPDIDGFDLMMKFKEQVENLGTEIASSDLKFVKNNINGGFDCILEDGTLWEKEFLIVQLVTLLYIVVRSQWRLLEVATPPLKVQYFCQNMQKLCI